MKAQKQEKDLDFEEAKNVEEILDQAETHRKSGNEGEFETDNLDPEAQKKYEEILKKRHEKARLEQELKE